jgi:hypothetical protein
MTPSNNEIKGSLFTYLADLFAKVGARCILVGGYALNVNFVQRATFDIDFMTTIEEYKKFESDLLLYGYSIYNRQDGFIQLKSSVFGLKDIDFLITNEPTINKLVAEGKQRSIGNRVFTVASPMHLLAMKLHSITGNPKRTLKDTPDIIALCELDEVKEKKDEAKEIFEKYNQMILFKKTSLVD